MKRYPASKTSTASSSQEELRTLVTPEGARIAAANRPLCYWGMFILGMYAVLFISPTQIQGIFRILTLSFSIFFIYIGFKRVKIGMTAPIPVIGALVLQLWSIFTQVYASQHLGRPLLLGRSESYLIEATIPFFVAYVIAAVDPRTIRWVSNLFLIAFGLSCAVAWLQFMRVGPAIALAGQYTYKSIDNWDGTSGLRAVGLTFHPNALAFQAVIAAGIMMGRILTEKRGKWDIAALLFFSGAVVASQSRQGYIIVIFSWIPFIIALFKQDRVLARKLIAGVVVALVLVVAVASKRLGYALQSTSVSNDTSLNYRQDKTWRQLDPIYPKLALTGIGPDKGLLLGTGPEDKWVPNGNVMESGYLVVLAMYGIPGLAIFILSLISSIAVSARNVLDRRLSAIHHQAAMMAFVAWLFLTLNCFTLNTIDSPMLLPCVFILTGLMLSASAKVRIPKTHRVARRMAIAGADLSGVRSLE